MIRLSSISRVFLILGTALSAACDSTRPQPAEVTFTWLSNTTWYIAIDGIQLFADAAISRWPFSVPDFDQPDSFQIPPVHSDTELVHRILSAVVPDQQPTYILVGHGHTDHTIDLATIAERTDAQIIGSRTACLQAQASGVAPARCQIVEGGEVLSLSPRLEVRVIRWTHSGNPDNRLGRLIQAPKELRTPPPTDPVTGGMGPAPWQGYPNGGGARAYLFRYDGDDGPLRWLISDTGNQFTFDSIPQIGPDYLEDVGVDLSHLDFVEPSGTPREWLAEAAADIGSDTIDVWFGYGNSAHVRQVEALIRPRFFVPHHWDSYLDGFTPGVTRPYSNPTLAAFLDSASISLLPPSQYLDRYRLTLDGLSMASNEALQSQMGLTRIGTRDSIQRN